MYRTTRANGSLPLFLFKNSTFILSVAFGYYSVPSVKATSFFNIAPEWSMTKNGQLSNYFLNTIISIFTDTEKQLTDIVFI